MEQGQYLSILSQVPAETLKPFVDSIFLQLGPIAVLSNRTGLVMLPYQESVKGVNFHVGEVLMAEGRVRLGDHEGYGACVGRDLQQALSIAILDAALQAGQLTTEIEEFIHTEAGKQADTDDLLMKQVEATRVEMETF